MSSSSTRAKKSAGNVSRGAKTSSRTVPPSREQKSASIASGGAARVPLSRRSTARVSKVSLRGAAQGVLAAKRMSRLSTKVGARGGPAANRKHSTKTSTDGKSTLGKKAKAAKIKVPVISIPPTGEDDSVSQSVLNSPLSPVLLDARSTALSALDELQKSLREKNEEGAVRTMNQEASGTSEADVLPTAPVATLPPPPPPPPSDNIDEPVIQTVEEEQHASVFIDEATLDDPDLQLHFRADVSTSPRAIITALTRRVKVLAALTAQTPTKATANDDADSSHSSTQLSIDTRKRMETQLEDLRWQLENEQLKVEKLKALEEEAQKTFALERMSKQKCEVELFNLRAEVSELRVTVREHKDEITRVRAHAEQQAENARKRAEKDVGSITKTHAELVDQTVKRHDEVREELERVRSRTGKEKEELVAELNSLRAVAEESSFTLKRHLEISIKHDEELRRVNAELKTCKERLEASEKNVFRKSSELRQAESKAMMATSEVAALREEVVRTRDLHMKEVTGAIQSENNALKAKVDDVSNEKDAIEEREAKLQDLCESLQGEVASYRHRALRAEDQAKLLSDRVKALMADKARMSKSLKQQQKFSAPWLVSGAADGILLKRGLYYDGKESMQVKSPSKSNAKKKSPAQKAAELIKYPKVTVAKSLERGTWRGGGIAKEPRKILSKASPPPFDRGNYGNTRNNNVSTAGRPWLGKGLSVQKHLPAEFTHSPMDASSNVDSSVQQVLTTPSGKTVEDDKDDPFSLHHHDEIATAWQDTNDVPSVDVEEQKGLASSSAVPIHHTIKTGVNELTDKHIVSLEELAKTLERVKEL